MQRDITAARPGPIVVAGKLSGMTARVEITDDTTQARIEVSTPDTSGAAYEVVRDAVLREEPWGLYVEIEPINIMIVNGVTFVTKGGGGGGMTVVGGGGSVVIGNVMGGMHQVNTFRSGVQIGGGVVQIGGGVGGGVYVNGVLQQPGGGGQQASGGIHITIRVPRLSTLGTREHRFEGGIAAGRGDLDSVRARGTNEDVSLPGHTRSVRVGLHNGSVQIGTVDSADVETHNGSIHVARVTRDARVATHNGTIEVRGDNNVPVRATSHNGNVYYGRNLDCDPDTHNGSVRAV